MKEDPLPASSLEGRRSHELQRDEDLLSPQLRAELESMGTALGFIGAFVLVAAQLPRAGRLFAKGAAGAAGVPEKTHG